MSYTANGYSHAGKRTIPQRSIQLVAGTEAEALCAAQQEADRLFLIDRYEVRLEVFGPDGKRIGIVEGPLKGLSRECEICRTKPARFRELYSCGVSEVCEDDAMVPGDRLRWAKTQTLLGIQDLVSGCFLDPITMNTRLS